MGLRVDKLDDFLRSLTRRVDVLISGPDVVIHFMDLISEYVVEISTELFFNSRENCFAFLLNLSLLNTNDTVLTSSEEFLKRSQGLVSDMVFAKEMFMNVKNRGLNVFNLTKRGSMKKQGGRIKTWKLRHFVLTAEYILYFKDSIDTNPKGFIPLAGISYSLLEEPRSWKKIKKSSDPGNPLSWGFTINITNDSRPRFGLKTNKKKGNHKLFKLKVSSKTELDGWILELQKCIKIGEVIKYSERISGN